MTNVVVIGCSPSDIISACQNTIQTLATGGHSVYALIASSVQFETTSSSSSSPSALLSVSVEDISQLTTVGITQTFRIETFDYSSVTQANADAINSVVKKVKPTTVIMPSWKSPDNRRRILARTSLIASRGIGTILMYELDRTINRSFNPTISFEVSANRSTIQHQGAKKRKNDDDDVDDNDNNNNNNQSKETSSRTTITIATTNINQDQIVNIKSVKNNATFQYKGPNANNTTSNEQIREQFESHRTLLLEEEGLF